MRKGCIALACLLPLCGPAAAELSGEELVDKLFSTCDASLADPNVVPTLANDRDHPATVTTDGKVLHAIQNLTAETGDFWGIQTFHAARLPAGNSVVCNLTLFDSVLTQESGSNLHNRAIQRARTLIGDDMISVGGMIAGQALLKSLTEAETEQMVLLVNSEFPPSTEVSIVESDGHTSIYISRYQAAP